MSDDKKKLQNSNVEKLRSDDAEHGTSDERGTDATGDTALQRDADQEALQAERAEALEKEAIQRNKFEGMFGFQTEDAELLSAAGEFDEQSTDPQPLEFRDFQSREYAKRGFI